MNPMSGWTSPEPVGLHGEISVGRHTGQMEAYCFICSCPLPEETETVEEYEAISICDACKVVFLERQDSNMQHSHSRRHNSRSRNHHLADSVEQIFSHRFSRLINQVRQNHVDASASSSHLRYRQPNDNASITAPSVTPNALRGRVQRRDRALSDNTSDLDSIFGESGTNASISGFGAFSVDSDAVSVTGYGLNSDASFDGRSLEDGEMYAREEVEEHIGSDMDIDPMHASMDHWDLDGEEEDGEGDWEEADVDQDAMDQINIWVRGATSNTEENAQIGLQEGGSSRGDTDGDVWHTNVSPDNYRDPDISSLFIDFFGVRTEVDPFVGNPDDYLGEGEFVELLNQLAETEETLRGAPPAAESILKSLPQIIISEVHEEHGGVICAICKDPLITGIEANQLPCMHLYHPSCILPWLSTRNSCPVCRYELLTDDKDYEEGKRVASGLPVREFQQLAWSEDNSSVASEDVDVDERSNLEWHSIGTGVRVVRYGEEMIAGRIIDQRVEQTNITGETATPNGINPGHRPGGWFLFAAAPIVTIVGVVLVLWFKNPAMEGGLNRIIRQTDRPQLDRSSGSSTTVNNNGGNRNRGWWSLF